MKKFLLFFLLFILVLFGGLLSFINSSNPYAYPEDGALSAIDLQIEREFKIQTLQLADSYDGPVEATLISRKADEPSGRAVLYIHGFGDYFFQRHLAQWYNDHGFDFYALDLRRYGRSWRAHQRPNYVEDLTEYFEEIDQAVDLIRQVPGHRFLLLNGHSTGGLTTSLYCHSGGLKEEIDALFLNAPFLDFNASPTMEKIIGGATASLGDWQAHGVIGGGGESIYTKALHKDFQGRWDFNTNWKPLKSFPIYLGWLRAIEQGHAQISAGLNITCPVLVMHSDKSYFGGKFSLEMQKADAVLDVKEIHYYSSRLGEQVKIVPIPGAIHDLFLSDPAVLYKAYGALDQWLNELIF